MKVLLHVCCGPCSIYPFSRLQSEGIEVEGYFFNPNIHPFQEFKKRLSALEQFSVSHQFSIILDKKYGLRDYLQKVIFYEDDRCTICYQMRLEKTIELAKELDFDAFSTTLLYSKYQRHDVIIDLCNKLSEKYEIKFLYRDFREGWQYGIDSSIKQGMYRQPYCGCIFSEEERYDKSLHKKRSK